MIKIEITQHINYDVLVIHSERDIVTKYYKNEWRQLFESLGINSRNLDNLLKLCTFGYNRVMIRGTREIEFVKSLIPEYFI